jgi:hypothetical protein
MQKATMGSLIAGLQLVKQHAPEMPISILLTLLGVAVFSPNGRAGENPLSIQDLSKIIGIPYTTTSRHLRYLGDFERPGKQGLGLVETGPLTADRRQKFVKLTPTGHELLRRFVNSTALDTDISSS